MHFMGNSSMWVGGGVVGQGTGVLNVGRAFERAPAVGSASIPSAKGTGTLQAARGTSAPTFGLDTAVLTGERDIFGPLSVPAWYKASAAGTSWQGGAWMGRTWTGATMGAAVDGQATWTSGTWAGKSWTGRYWSDIAWAGATWNGRYWSNTTAFNGRYWSGATWQASGWLNSVDGAKWML
jgi:serine protease AprX